MIPVHRETKNLQTLQDRSVIIPPRVIIFPRVIKMNRNVTKNESMTNFFLKDIIVKVLSAIDNVVSYHNIVKKRQE